ncbi:lactate utilization protein, partial [Chloroflexota bacterium]
LKKNNIDAEYASDREEALAKVKKAIPKDATIGIGDSITLHQIGFFSWLEKESNRVLFDAFTKDAESRNIYSPEERFELMRKAITADIFLTSSNAVTLEGKLVNIDARGNRVAAMIFGPKKTIIVIGANKIVKDTDEAFKRIKFICAPFNMKRHVLKHHYEFFEKLPCVEKGICVECNSPMKVCRKIVVIDGQMKIPSLVGTEIYVIMVGESLGI